MPAAQASNFVCWVPNKLPQQVAPPSTNVNLMCQGPFQWLPGENSDGLAEARAAPASNFVHRSLNKLLQQVAPPSKVVNLKCQAPFQ